MTPLPPSTTSLAHLGRGWSFPVRPDPASGRLPLAEGPEKVRQAMELILDTEPGERVMRPDFGCGLRRYLMRPNTVATRALLRRDVERALTVWEPRIKLTSVDAVEGGEPSLVLLSIAYVHVRDGRPGSLVYPFYLE